MKKIVFVVEIMLITLFTTYAQDTLQSETSESLWGDQKYSIIPWTSLSVKTGHVLPWLGKTWYVSGGIRPLNRNIVLGLTYGLYNRDDNSKYRQSTIFVGYESHLIIGSDGYFQFPNIFAQIHIPWVKSESAHFTRTKPFIRTGISLMPFFLFPTTFVFDIDLNRKITAKFSMEIIHL